MNSATQWCIVRFGIVLLVGGEFIIGNVDAKADAASSCDGHWHVMATANAAKQPNDYNLLAAVAALSTRDVWAVGIFDQFTQSGYKTLAEHWDGSQWKLVHTPNTSQLNNVLAGLASTGTNDVWAVGYQSPASGPYSTLVEHWNAKAWKIVPSGTVTGLLT